MRELTQAHVWPDPAVDEDGFIEALLAAGDPTERPCLIELEGSTLEVIGRHRDRVAERFRVVIPREDALEIANDKALTARFFGGLDLAAPTTLSIQDENDIANWVGGFPAVFKPRRGKGGRGQRIVNSFDEALSTWCSLRAGPQDYLLQEWIPGPPQELYTVGILCRRGGVIRGLFSGRRLEVVETPTIPQGVTAWAQSERVPEMLDIAERFAAASTWEGMAELEFKRDPRDGRFKILEINPRIWAWVQLPISCGVDFPALYYDLAVHGDCEERLEFATGVRYLRSVLHFYTQLYRFRSGSTGFLQFIRSSLSPYADVFRKGKRVVLEDLGLRPEYRRWFLFYLRETGMPG
jgi:predicted ATP-grasp superfamily ATP-dependent carboligase